MPYYTYETIDETGAAESAFELYQSIHDAPLVSHPDTGVPVRRVISGGLGYLNPRARSSAPPGDCCPGCHD